MSELLQDAWWQAGLDDVGVEMVLHPGRVYSSQGHPVNLLVLVVGILETQVTILTHVQVVVLGFASHSTTLILLCLSLLTWLAGDLKSDAATKSRCFLAGI